MFRLLHDRGCSWYTQCAQQIEVDASGAAQSGEPVPRDKTGTAAVAAVVVATQADSAQFAVQKLVVAENDLAERVDVDRATAT